MLQTSLAAQKAKARMRARAKARTLAPANDNVVRLAPPAPLELTAGDVVIEHAGDEAPFLPPPVDDIFGLGECDEEETIFVDAPAAAAEAESFTDALEEDAPFDPPEFDDEPVFSAPFSVQPDGVMARAPEPEAPKPRVARERAPMRERPLPAISIYASWDRAEAETLLEALAADPRLGRAELTIARGGLDGAAAYCASHEPPDLVILDTDLQGRPMLEGLDRLRAAAPRAAVVVLGGVNDITLLRELGARGVSDYIVPPATPRALAASICRLFAAAAPARTIAIIGARGGVGASTIAHNVAFSIAERQQARTTLVDFDLSLGAAAFNFQQASQTSIADVLDAEDADEALSRALIKLTPRLQLVCAPDHVECADIDTERFDRAMAEVRRASAHVVLDLPHLWEPWVRQALRQADEVVIVATPDLASLRNTDNMLKLMRSERGKTSVPIVVLSMAGVPKRPEIPLKDFAEAIHAKPAMTFAFEPELFARAQASGEMIYEAMPDAKAALQLDTLASLLTGRQPHAQPAPRSRAIAPAVEPSATTPEPMVADSEPLVLDNVVAAPKPTKRRTARTGFLALQAPPEPKRRRPRGFLRAAAAVIALAAASAYYLQQQRGAADIAPSQTGSAISA